MRKLPNEDRSKALDRTPHRKCIITGESNPQDELVRLALGPDGQVAPDIRAKAPGRGAWIGTTGVVLAQALSDGHLKSGLMRAFKTSKVEISADLPMLIEQALERATLERLGLEARGGLLFTGAEKIETAARQGKLAMLLHAVDAGQDGRSKLDQAWRVGSEREGQNMRGTILPVDRQVLSVALGRQNVVHVGIVDMRAAGRISHILNRWRHFIDAENCDDGADKKVA